MKTRITLHRLASYPGLMLGLLLLSPLAAQNVGIGTATPSERLHVAGNLRLDNAFMPGNDAGAVGNILLSQGANTAPIWLANGDSGSVLMSMGADKNPIWAPNPNICTSPTLNRFIKFTSTSPVKVCNTTLAEETDAPNRIWNADGAASAFGTDKFSIYALEEAPWAINGYSTIANGGGVYGQATGADGIGVWGAATGANGIGVFGTTNQPAGWGVYGFNLATTGNAVGVQGVTASPAGLAVVGIHTPTSGTGVGVWGQTASGAGTGGVFINNAASGTGTGDGVYGRTAQSQGFGVWGVNIHANGTGVVGAGNNSIPNYLGTGSGGAFTGSSTGTYTEATSNAGNALIAYNSAAYSATATGSAGVFISRAGNGSALVAHLRNDASGLNWSYLANTAIAGINMRADGDPWGVAGVVANGGAANPGTGVWGQNTSNGANAWGVYANGRLGASGGKAFHIDHPLDPENKYLTHYATEGPEPYTIYRGVITTDASGEAVVQLPSYFEALNRPGDYHYSLTCIGTFAQAIIAQEIKNNQFVIRTDKPHVKVAWVVTGVRNDVYARHFWMPAETEKPAEHKGKYLIPQLYGKDDSYGIFSSRLRNIELKTVERVEAHSRPVPLEPQEALPKPLLESKMPAPEK